jgi:hypothetical protein
MRDLCSSSSNFKKGYRPSINIVKNEKGNLVTDCHSILARWGSHFSQLLNVHGVNDVRQTEIHTSEPLVPEPSAFWFEMAIGKLKRHESTGTDQMPAKLIKAGGRTVLSQIHKRIIFRIRRNCLRMESIILPIYKKGDKTNCINYTGISPLSTAYKILSNILLSKLTGLGDDIWGIISVDFDATCQLLIIYFASFKYLRKNGNTMKLSLREGPGLRVFENRVLRRIFRPKRDEVTGEWK